MHRQDGMKELVLHAPFLLGGGRLVDGSPGDVLRNQFHVDMQIKVMIQNVVYFVWLWMTG